MDRERLRLTFGEDAELYNRHRPGYPAELFEQLGVGPGSRVLEIGCGTGQATVPLARLGCSIVAVELSADLAMVAERNLAGLGDVEVVVSAFEDWPLPERTFDLVVSATAFHWLDPEVRVTKAADALVDGGALAVISTEHVAGGTEPFFADAQTCYERFDPATPPGLRLQPSVDIPADSAEFDESGRFGPVRFQRYEWELTYTAGAYLKLLSTYSGHRALPESARRNLFACLTDLIDNRYGGRITKRFMTQLALARRIR
jgi:SAM-dependent methyltransferase